MGPPVTGKTPIERLAAAGYPLIPLKGKIPAVKDWTKTSPGAYSVQDLGREGQNYGVVLGPGDLVVDVDPRNFTPGDKPLARLIEKTGPLKTFTVKTGGGGLHLYFKKNKEDYPNTAHTLADYPGIEFKSAGRQVVGPGSTHPETGKVYEVVVDAPIAQAPAGLLELIKVSAVPYAGLGEGGAENEKGEAGDVDYRNDEGTQGRYVDYLKRTAPLSVEGKQGDATAFRVACYGRDLGLAPGITYALMAEYWNGRCTPPWDGAELEAKIINAYKYAKRPAGNSSPAADFERVEGGGGTAAESEKEKISWRLTKNGSVIKCFHNLCNYLRLPDGGLNRVFGYNEFTGQVEFINPAPWHKGILPRGGAGGSGGMLQDHDLKLLKGYLVERFDFEANVGTIEEAVTNVAFHHKFHPVREYLESVKGTWDGTSRVETWLHDYAGVPLNNYTKAVARKVLCAAVMRIMRPGIKFDHILVLEGPQNAGKSQLVKALGGRWAADFTVDPTNKDTVDSMQGKWFVEMAEMSVLNRAEMSALKAFVTRDTDRVRQAYGRLTREFPRQCIFIGTINPEADGAYLTDPTGNRRFWPVVTGRRINFRGVAGVRNQLFAEAMMLVEKGEALYLDNEKLEEEARVVVADRHASDPWVERIGAWLHEDREAKAKEFVTARDIYIDALGGIDKQLVRREVIRIANVMRALGWRAGTKRASGGGGAVVRGYHRPVDVVAGTAAVASDLGDLV